jgi:Glycosyl transferases group 1
MARIIFLNPFSKTVLAEGIKTTYRHAEMLSEMGFEAYVLQPDGRPPWFDSTAPMLPAPPRRFDPSDIVVFPEVLSGLLAEILRSPLDARKVLFCDAQYNTLFNKVPPEQYAQAGFARTICHGLGAREFLSRYLHLRDVVVVSHFIDSAKFRPGPKAMQIALLPGKRIQEAVLIQGILSLKYPQFRSVPWIVVENKNEREAAEIFARSAIVLSLPYLQSFGLAPLEAMACGAIVIGFRGYGGEEYATPENGYWFAPDHLEELVDRLAQTIDGLVRGDPSLDRIQQGALKFARGHNKERTRTALREAYGPLVWGHAK